jgi:hypothetical protein
VTEADQPQPGPGAATDTAIVSPAPAREPDESPPGDSSRTGSPPAEAQRAGSPSADGRPDEGDERDPWSAFGPVPDLPPSGVRAAVLRLGRLLGHEWTLAALAALALAVVMTWPTLRHPASTIPQDYWDPSLQAWQMAWSGHILLTDPGQLWHANGFYPERWSFAFSDTLLGYAPAGMIGDGPAAATVRYNVMFVLAHALAAFGGYALARQLGAGRLAAAVAGASYTYAPWLLAQAGHLHVISNGGIPLALAMLARGHGWSMRHGYRPDRQRPGWALAGWLVAAWQITLGFGIGLPFAYILGLIMAVALVAWFVRSRFVWSTPRPIGWRLLAADLAGLGAFVATGAALAVPYFRVAELHPYAKRSAAELIMFSPPPRGFLTAPAESLLWGELHEQARAGLIWHPEMTLLPGFALYALAAAGLVFSIWTVRQRLLLLLGLLVSAAFAMGTNFYHGSFTYLLLFEHLPGWDGLRTPGRLTLWTTLLLGILAAGAVSAFVERAHEISAAERVPPRPGPLLRLATLVPLLLVLGEGLNATPQPVVPQQPAALRSVDGPLLVLPSDQGTDQLVMLWSTTHFQPLVNGGSGFTPRRLDEVRQATLTFPDQASVDYLRALGVRTVVVLRDRVAGTPWETTIDLPVDALGILRDDVGNTVVYRL